MALSQKRLSWKDAQADVLTKHRGWVAQESALTPMPTTTAFTINVPTASHASYSPSHKSSARSKRPPSRQGSEGVVLHMYVAVSTVDDIFVSIRETSRLKVSIFLDPVAFLCATSALLWPLYYYFSRCFSCNVVSLLVRQPSIPTAKGLEV